MKPPLYDRHCSAGAKIVPFAGWEMPLQYQGIIQETNTVRNHVGVFDVSHMGLIEISGSDSEELLDYLSTHRISGHPDGSATYTVWSLPCGGTVDDLLVYRTDQEHFFVVTNAENRKADLEHLKTLQSKYSVHIQERFDTHGILAVQGPQAMNIILQILPCDPYLPHRHFQIVDACGGKVIVSMTGYTGAGGCELISTHDVIVKIWDALMNLAVSPIGLGARETLRLEMGYALYGHELSYTIAAPESIAAWVVQTSNRDFQGKKAFQLLAESGFQRRAYGVVLEDKAVPRQGCHIRRDGKVIGKVTSGGYSPTLDKSVALILVSHLLKEGDSLEMEIRHQWHQGKVVALPFVK